MARNLGDPESDDRSILGRHPGYYGLDIANGTAAIVRGRQLRVVGDGITSRYQDREPGYTTLHGRGSLAAIAGAVGEPPELTEQRFRSNIAVDDLDAWEEQHWIGRNLRIGNTEFKVINPVTRCLATHAHPITGKRDLPVMKALLQLIPTEKPTFAIMMLTDRGGTVRVGDKIELTD